jgi:hypothetical protein
VDVGRLTGTEPKKTVVGFVEGFSNLAEDFLSLGTVGFPHSTLSTATSISASAFEAALLAVSKPLAILLSPFPIT